MASAFNLRRNYAPTPAPAPHEDQTIDSPAVFESLIANFVWMLIFQLVKFLWTSYGNSYFLTFLAFIANILNNITARSNPAIQSEQSPTESSPQQSFQTVIDMTDADGSINRLPV